ncbi:MAG: glycosyltransferase family 2 protein [Desulfomonilaceae bacterium]
MSQSESHVLKSPVAFLIFNRPDTTARVFAEIAKARPAKLLVVADGPREDNPADYEKCQQARAIIDQVDWECEVHNNYSPANLGCKRRISSALDWVFDTVEKAIILEDDVLPNPTFFRYCDELLEKYAEDERVGAICGCNFQNGRKRDRYSYYFSRYPHVWGWATWAHAWKHYDVDMQLWEAALAEGYLRGMFRNEHTLEYWTATFQAVYEGKIDTWDYQWAFACWLNNMLAVLPQVNLITNIGFGEEATHTADPFSETAGKTASSMTFPLVHPPFVMRHETADEYTDEQQFYLPGWRNVSNAECPLCKLRERCCSGQVWTKIRRVIQLIRKRDFRVLFGKIAARLKLEI